MSSPALSKTEQTEIRALLRTLIIELSPEKGIALENGDDLVSKLGLDSIKLSELLCKAEGHFAVGLDEIISQISHALEEGRSAELSIESIALAIEKTVTLRRSQMLANYYELEASLEGDASRANRLCYNLCLLLMAPLEKPVNSDWCWKWADGLRVVVRSHDKVFVPPDGRACGVNAIIEDRSDIEPFIARLLAAYPRYLPTGGPLKFSVLVLSFKKCASLFDRRAAWKRKTWRTNLLVELERGFHLQLSADNIVIRWVDSSTGNFIDPEEKK